MLVSIDQPYAAAIVVPATASAKATWPDAALVYTGFAAIGAFLGFIVFSLRAPVHVQTRREKPQTQEWFKTDTQNNNEPFKIRTALGHHRSPGLAQSGQIVQSHCNN